MIQQLLASCQGIIQNGSSSLSRSSGTNTTNEASVDVAEELGTEVGIEGDEKDEAEDTKAVVQSSNPSAISKSPTASASAYPTESTT